MELSPTQIQAFEENGFLLVERVFSEQEVAILNQALPEAIATNKELDFEPGSKIVRLGQGLHLAHEAFRKLSHHPRLVLPSRQLLKDQCYIYQTRFNLKAAFSGIRVTGYPWHQDYSTWYYRDGLPEPNAIVVITFLDDVSACNAPMFLIPGSHKGGLITQGATPDQKQWVIIAPELIQDLYEQGGIEAQTGPAGSVLFMHANTVHASGENISPMRRLTFTTNYCTLENVARRPGRSEIFAARQIIPVVSDHDDCLRVAS